MTGIIIVGYGRMGKEIEGQAGELGIPVYGIADSYQDLQHLLPQLKDRNSSFVAIEFTGGDAAGQNLRYLLQQGVATVCGSTPWTQEVYTPLLSLCEQFRGYLMHSSNFSIGVNIFWHVVRHASRLMDSFSQYDLGIYEQHHNKKVDSPSGTAISTAQIVLQEVKRKQRMLCGNPQDYSPINPEELQLSSQRCGHNAGMHQLFCESSEDSIVVSHSARNRVGFARGAIAAAQFLERQVQRQHSGFFTMDDLMNYFLQQNLGT